MPIEFNCPSCLKGYRVADSHVGKRVKCKSCGNAMTVPDLSGLTLSDDTREVQRPPKRHSSTKILPENRPRPQAPQRNTPSDTARLADTPAPKLPGGKLPPGKIPAALQGKPELAKLKRAPTRAHQPEVPRKRKPNFVFILGALGVIAGFFLPWFSVSIPHFEGTVAGFNLALKGGDLASAMALDGVYADNPIVQSISGKPDRALALFALYLIPALALYGVVDDLRCAGKGKGRWYLRLVVALSPVLAGAIIYLALREPINAYFAAGVNIDRDAAISALGPGAYTIAGAWLVLLLGVVLAPRVKKPDTPAPPPNAKEPA
ncbi:MAG: zinc-ribbon domain-containing protein [Planctomycetes bacterium]|nr:zinc-ribbon domain-containing protein [Planctomycetota bacterium]